MLSATLALMAVSPAQASVKASSEGASSDGSVHPAKHLVDGRLDTAWAEGEDGSGEGSWVELTLDRVTDIESISIWPGRIDSGSRGLREYGRPHTVTVTLSGGGGEDISVQQRVLDIAETGPTRLDVAIQGKARKVKVTLDEVYTGGIYNQTYITELAVNFTGGPVHPSVQKVLDWRASDAGKKAAEEHAAEVAELKTKVSEADFGGREDFEKLAEMAAEGPAFIWDRVRGVPDGYRIGAVPPSTPALNALLELEDPNAIASIELAATRTTGKLATQLKDRASRFEAFSELKGGGKRNVKPYGETGFTKGCLRGLGEPLGLAVDDYSGVWIADMANHRIQRFNFDGISEMVVGDGEPSLSNQWLGRTRDWYVSGNTAGTGNGAFTLPVSVATVPGKDGDGLLVLDAAGTVTRLDPSGTPLKSWSLGVEVPLTAGIGGEGHIALAKKNIVTVWGNDVRVYDLEGTEVNAFTLEDGVAGGLVGFKNGKFATLHDDDLVLYSADGFRHGGQLDNTVPEGFEYLAVATDENGKLWVITDHGYAVKYKKPGTVDFKVKLVDYSFSVPRADVFDNLVFVSDKDSFKKFDALELSAQQNAE